MSQCCHRCKSIPGVCALSQRCRCHNATAKDRAEQLARDLERAALNRHPQVPDHTQRAILAARLGIDSAVDVARTYKVPVGAVFEIWRDARKDDT